MVPESLFHIKQYYVEQKSLKLRKTFSLHYRFKLLHWIIHIWTISGPHT